MLGGGGGIVVFLPETLATDWSVEFSKREIEGESN